MKGESVKTSRRRHLFEKLSAQNLQQTPSSMVKIKFFNLAFNGHFCFPASPLHTPTCSRTAEWHYLIVSDCPFTLPPLGSCPYAEEDLGPQPWPEYCSEPVPILTSAKKPPEERNQWYVVLGTPAFFLHDFSLEVQCIYNKMHVSQVYSYMSFNNCIHMVTTSPLILLPLSSQSCAPPISQTTTALVSITID